MTTAPFRPPATAAERVLCNADAWGRLGRAELLDELRQLARMVIAEAKGAEP